MLTKAQLAAIVTAQSDSSSTATPAATTNFTFTPPVAAAPQQQDQGPIQFANPTMNINNIPMYVATPAQYFCMYAPTNATQAPIQPAIDLDDAAAVNFIQQGQAPQLISAPQPQMVTAQQVVPAQTLRCAVPARSRPADRDRLGLMDLSSSTSLILKVPLIVVSDHEKSK